MTATRPVPFVVLIFLLYQSTTCALALLSTARMPQRFFGCTRKRQLLFSPALQPRSLERRMALPCYARHDPSNFASHCHFSRVRWKHGSSGGIDMPLRVSSLATTARPRDLLRYSRYRSTTPLAMLSASGDHPHDLHGIFAVYKPQGFTSAGAVAKIKNILSKGLRDEISARDASDKDDAASRGVFGDVEAQEERGEISGGGVREGATGPRKLDEGPRVRSGGGGDDRRQKKLKIKVGHGGTLDPMATGVLVIGVGKGCRELAKFLQGSKGYRAEGLLGHETNTQDAEGAATLHGEWSHVTNKAIDDAIGQFTGNIMQVPPMFSALQKDGRRMYEMARQGITVEREPRPVTVYTLRQVQPHLPLPRFSLDVECGGGFYVRTLIEDLARVVGSRAHMTALERIQQGPFELRHALPLEDWTYKRLCGHLKESQDMLAMLGGDGNTDGNDGDGAVTIGGIQSATEVVEGTPVPT